MIVNSTTNHHHFPDDDPAQLTAEAIVMFLEQTLSQSLPVVIFLFPYILDINTSWLCFFPVTDLWGQLMASTCLPGLLWNDNCCIRYVERKSRSYNCFVWPSIWFPLSDLLFNLLCWHYGCWWGGGRRRRWVISYLWNLATSLLARPSQLTAFYCFFFQNFFMKRKNKLTPMHVMILIGCGIHDLLDECMLKIYRTNLVKFG